MTTIYLRLARAKENELMQRQVTIACLETGINQPEALGLYLAIGYSLRTPFGAYIPDPISVFMERKLSL